MKAVWVLAGTLGLAGCASVSRHSLSDFESQHQDGQVTFTFWADELGPPQLEGREEREQQRIGWLETYLAENDLCPEGYVVESRRRITQVSTPDIKTEEGTVREYGNARRFYYWGRCR